ncbi:MAG: right-handed parallel beta-helix repeat-containing protein, partial [Holophagales bacterium]|nr:right-handed parallel beta-helix repeat-containing protein [Holophagales bacterium]
MPRSPLRFLRAVLPILLVAALAVDVPTLAQTPDDASDGVVLVHTLAGTTAADKIDACIQIFAASPDPAGTCDARGLPGGDIDFRIMVNVPGLQILLGGGKYELLNDGGFRLTADHTSLEGLGDHTHLDGSAKTGASAAVDVWNAGGQTVVGARVRNLRITGVRTEDPQDGYTSVRVRNGRYVLFEALTVSDQDKAALAVADSEEVLVTGNAVSEITGNGIQVTGTSRRVQIFNNRFSRVGLKAAVSSSFGAVTIIGSDEDGPAPSWIRVAENTIRHYGGAGIRVTRWGDSIPSEVQIVNNQIDQVAPELINFEDPRATKDGECIGVSGNNIQILGNRARGAYVNGIAIWLNTPNGTIENITVSGNTVSNSSQMPGSGNVHHGVALILKEGLAHN